MALVKDEIIVLKGVDFSEADRILTVFGRFRGKFTLMAKGVRKLESKNRGNIQTLSVAKISYYEGRNMGTLRESEYILAPDYSVKDTKWIERVLFIVNKMMQEEEPDQEIFDMILRLFEVGFSPRAVNKFRLAVLDKLGFVGDLKSCSKCGEANKLSYFHIRDLGFICENCNGVMDSSVVEVKDMKYEGMNMTEALDVYVRRVVED